MDQSLLEYVQGTIEALLFVSEKPIQIEQFKEVLETVSASDIKEVLSNLQKEYTLKNRGMMIVEIAGGYQMLSSPSYAMAIRRFYKTTHKEKLSKPALETLAIVAYKQPVAKMDVELIRGVNSDGVVGHLLAKGLIKIVGRKEVPGRPFIYGTTQQFLEYFGLKSLDDLPKLEEFSLLQPVETIPEQTVSSIPAAEANEEFSQSRNETKIPSDTVSTEEENTSETVIKKEVDVFFKQAKDFNSEESVSQADPSSQKVNDDLASSLNQEDEPGVKSGDSLQAIMSQHEE